MQSSSALGRELRIRLSDIINEVGFFSLTDINTVDGLKCEIVNNQLYKINITSESSFIIEATPKFICQAILRDYYYGHLRIKNQWSNVVSLADKDSIAWTMVSAYYCAFFSAIEALRICRRHLLNLSKDEARSLFSRSINPPKKGLLSQNNFLGVISEDFTKIGYSARSSKPHQATWNLTQECVLPIVSRGSPAWIELSKFINICKGVSGWELPNDIRNRWNYTDPIYFSKAGFSARSPFLKLLQNNNYVASWIKSKSGINSENDSAATIASLNHLLMGAINDTFEFGFLTSKFFKK